MIAYSAYIQVQKQLYIIYNKLIFVYYINIFIMILAVHHIYCHAYSKHMLAILLVITCTD